MAKRPKIRKRPQTYWSKRSVERTLATEAQMSHYSARIGRVYDTARRQTVREVQKIYETYYKDNKFDTQALRSIMPSGSVMRFKREMKRLGLETELPSNYAARVNRLDFLNLQMWAEVKKASQFENKNATELYLETIKDGFYRTIYDTAKGLGHTPAFSQLNTRTVDKILMSANHGRHYSSRIWDNSNKTTTEIKDIIASALASGQSPEKTVRQLRERFDVSANNARRLVRTETSYFENQAELEAYEAMDIEEYQFLATLDGRTSAICQSLDNQRFKVKEVSQA